jgi:hypothetical protein
LGLLYAKRRWSITRPVMKITDSKILAGSFLFFSLMKRTKNQGLRKKKLKISLSGKMKLVTAVK